MRKDQWHRPKKLFSTPIPKVIEKPKVRWKFGKILWMALKRTCMVLGFMVLFSALIGLWTTAQIVNDIAAPLPQDMVLYLELDGGLSELPQEPTLSQPIVDGTRTLRNFTRALDRAKNDPRVKGIYANLKQGRYPLANIQEIRTAIKDFRESGKFAYIYASSYDTGLGGYYLATAFDEIWLQPMGIVMLGGLYAEMPFMRDVLDKAGVEPQFFQRKEYKNAYESLTSSEMSEATRESMQVLINDLTNAIVQDIATDTEMTPAQFKQQVDRSLITAGDALSAGLVHHLHYMDEADDIMKQRVLNGDTTRNVSYVSIDTYVQDMLSVDVQESYKTLQTKQNVALIYASGVIMDSGDLGAQSNIMGNDIAAADEIAAALSEAKDNDTIKAIVLRVNSPGGSPVASETILRAIQTVQDKGKPVIVSMGASAASGGYWISASANRIFVLPTTITGSIGVLGGKISLQNLWKKIGVNWESIPWGENAGMWSMNKPFSESEAERFNAMLDNIYENFITRVAIGRKMDKDSVENIARGRVWSGYAAVQNGLADQIGGLNEALDYAAQQAGAKDRHDVNVVLMPKPLTPVEQFIALLQGEVKAGGLIGTLKSLAQAVKPIARHIDIVSNQQQYETYMPITIK